MRPIFRDCAVAQSGRVIEASQPATPTTVRYCLVAVRLRWVEVTVRMIRGVGVADDDDDDAEEDGGRMRDSAFEM